jgi:hypothetical protein
MKQMLHKFKQSKFAVRYFTDEEYAELENAPDYVPPAPVTPDHRTHEENINF